RRRQARPHPADHCRQPAARSARCHYRGQWPLLALTCMSSGMDRTIILGGGMTGLAAGCASGLPVYEATGHPGGICCSYYMRPGSNVRLPQAPSDNEAYRFEIGGGHWIFGGEPAVLEFISRASATKTYFRKSSVFLPD